MKVYLGGCTAGKDNNFNLLRFIAASLVLYSHSFALVYGSGEFEPLRASLGMTFGSIAVDIFFVTSGFLVTRSLVHRFDFKFFIISRFLRIFPALFVSILLSIIILGFLFSDLNLKTYFLDSQIYVFFIKNITLIFGIEYNLPGVFENNPYAYAVNGSLWSLPYEVKMYAILVLVFYFCSYIRNGFFVFDERYAILLIWVLFFSISFFLESYFHIIFYLGSMFFSGSVIYLFREKITISMAKLLIGLVILIFCFMYGERNIFLAVYCVFIPFVVLFFAYISLNGLKFFNNFGDYSYGIYIYAFPVQQALCSLISDIEVTSMVVYSFFITLIFSMLSWHFIEKKFIEIKKRMFINVN